MTNLIINAIDGLVNFLNTDLNAILFGNVTRRMYKDGLVRVDSNGSNRGSFVEGLDTLDKTINFLKSLDWKEIFPSNAREGCTYFNAVIENFVGHVGVITVKDAQELGLDIRVVDGAHGKELVADWNGVLPVSNIVTIIVEDGMMSTWYVGEITKDYGDLSSEWDDAYAVKLV